MIWGGGGGGHQMITSAYTGEGGRQEGPKCDYVIFECSLVACQLKACGWGHDSHSVSRAQF